MANVLGTHPPTISIPSPIPELAGVLLDNSWGLVAKPPLSFSQVRYLTENRASSWKKAESMFSYSPKTDVRSGLEKTVAWYKENNLL
jgi:nucleoside-diphosphate-sugar epimerase